MRLARFGNDANLRRMLGKIKDREPRCLILIEVQETPVVSEAATTRKNEVDRLLDGHKQVGGTLAGGLLCIKRSAYSTS